MDFSAGVWSWVVVVVRVRWWIDALGTLATKVSKILAWFLPYQDWD